MKPVDLIGCVYCECVEDLGLSPEQILLVLLEKQREEIEYLKKKIGRLENEKV
jgi:hypothetical protein